MCLFSDECFTFFLRFVLSSLLKSVRNDASNMVKLVFNQSWNDRAVTISGIAKKPRNKIWVKIGNRFFLFFFASPKRRVNTHGRDSPHRCLHIQSRLPLQIHKVSVCSRYPCTRNKEVKSVTHIVDSGVNFAVPPSYLLIVLPR